MCLGVNDSESSAALVFDLAGRSGLRSLASLTVVFGLLKNGTFRDNYAGLNSDATDDDSAIKAAILHQLYECQRAAVLACSSAGVDAFEPIACMFIGTARRPNTRSLVQSLITPTFVAVPGIFAR